MKLNFLPKLINLFKNPKKGLMGGVLMVISTILANLLNFAYNAYLGRELKYEDFALISLMGGFLYLSRISFSGFSSTLNHRSAFLSGRFNDNAATQFWKKVRRKTFLFASVAALIWLALTPNLTTFFKSDEPLPYIFFAFVWLVGFTAAVDKGFMLGKLMFASFAFILFIEPVIKLVAAVLLVQLDLSYHVYLSIPISIVGAYLIGWFMLRKQLNTKFEITNKEVDIFPKKYFVAAIVSGLTTTLFLSLDIVLAKHFLSPVDAGKYALISLVGKMIYFQGSIANQFLVPLVSKNEGANKSSKKLFHTIVLIHSLLTLSGFVVFGLFGYISAPLLYGEKAKAITEFLPLFSFSMACFAISRVFESYYLAKRIYIFTIVSFILSCVQVLLVTLSHGTVESMVSVMTTIGIANLAAAFMLHLVVGKARALQRNIGDLFAIISDLKKGAVRRKEFNIVIFNWRDTKHTWAGGAEIYVQKLAEKWVESGFGVTIFCSNDLNNQRDQIIKGVRIFRRGGFMTVYIWAFLYYILIFRKRINLIIDCENGIPFFTALYSRKTIILLIHHVHQEIHRKHLPFPFYYVAMFLEGKLMPWLYQSKNIVTVSNSSKKEIIKLGFTNEKNIEIVNPGIDESSFVNFGKTKKPTFIYLGRLKAYKNIDIAIKAFAKINNLFPEAKLLIVGEGDNQSSLVKLIRKLSIGEKVKFTGYVTDKQRSRLLSKSWAMIQPSSMEGWGITVIEANAAGTPVIASNVNGLKDSVINNKTGVLVEKRNIEALYLAMRKIITNDTFRQTLSKNAVIWAQEFKWDKGLLKFNNHIERALMRDQVKVAPANGLFIVKEN